MRMRSGLAAGVVALALGLAACSGGSSGGNSGSTGSGGNASGPTGSITVNGSEPQNPLIPTNTTETGGGNVVDAMWTGLIAYDPDSGAPSLAQAESIESSDFKSWTIKIKKGWKFHDGTEVKAKNYVDAWNYGAFGPNGQQNQYFFGPGYVDIAGFDKVSDPKATVKEMSGLKVVDDYTFTVDLNTPNSLFKTIIGYSAFYAMPDSFFADPKAFEAKPIGDGPFKFVSRVPSQSIKLTAFDDYQGTKPKVKDVEFKIYQSLDAAYNDVVANNLDVIDAMPTKALAGDLWKKDLEGRLVDKPLSSRFSSITFPLYLKEFQNPDLRKAISMAIDRDQVIKIAFNGTRVPADGWVPPGNDGYQQDVCGDLCKFDAAKAKEELAKAGGFNGTLTIAYNADGGHKEWVDATCVSITNAIGVKCQGKPYPEFGPFRKDVTAKKMTGLIRTGWQADYPSIQNFLVPLYQTKASSNDGDYSNPAFDKLTQEAVSLQADQANAKYGEAEKILAQDMPVIPMWYSRLQGGWSDKVTNVKFNWQGRVDLLSISTK